MATAAFQAGQESDATTTTSSSLPRSRSKVRDVEFERLRRRAAVENVDVVFEWLRRRACECECPLEDLIVVCVVKVRVQGGGLLLGLGSSSLRSVSDSLSLGEIDFLGTRRQTVTII